VYDPTTADHACHSLMLLLNTATAAGAAAQDFCVNLHLWDETTQDMGLEGGLTVVAFCSDRDLLPQVAAPGDIILLRNVTVGWALAAVQGERWHGGGRGHHHCWCTGREEGGEEGRWLQCCSGAQGSCCVHPHPKQDTQFGGSHTQPSAAGNAE
jgi:hypothetical protein